MRRMTLFVVSWLILICLSGKTVAQDFTSDVQLNIVTDSLEEVIAAFSPIEGLKVTNNGDKVTIEAIDSLRWLLPRFTFYSNKGMTSSDVALVASLIWDKQCDDSEMDSTRPTVCYSFPSTQRQGRGIVVFPCKGCGEGDLDLLPEMQKLYRLLLPAP